MSQLIQSQPPAFAKRPTLWTGPLPSSSSVVPNSSSPFESRAATPDQSQQLGVITTLLVELSGIEKVVLD
jgi:hypothetical protein